jgi:hypothetical protein
MKGLGENKKNEALLFVPWCLILAALYSIINTDRHLPNTPSPLADLSQEAAHRSLKGEHRERQRPSNQGLNAVCDSLFARAILAIILELLVRLGAKWHGAHKSDKTDSHK